MSLICNLHFNVKIVLLNSDSQTTRYLEQQRLCEVGPRPYCSN